MLHFVVYYLFEEALFSQLLDSIVFLVLEYSSQRRANFVVQFRPLWTYLQIFIPKFTIDTNTRPVTLQEIKPTKLMLTNLSFWGDMTLLLVQKYLVSFSPVFSRIPMMPCVWNPSAICRPCRFSSLAVVLPLTSCFWTFCSLWGHKHGLIRALCPQR